MLSLTANNIAALNERKLNARDFISFTARDRTTGDPVTDHLWSGIGEITVDVVNPSTGTNQSRTFTGGFGDLIKVSGIPRVANMSVQNVEIVLSQISTRVAELVRVYDCQQATVEIFRGLFDFAEMNIVSAAYCRFAGFVDEINIKTPPEGEEGDVTMTCVSHTQELTRTNPDMRSQASQLLRSATDNFYQDTAVVSEWPQRWGMKTGTFGTAGVPQR